MPTLDSPAAEAYIATATPGRATPWRQATYTVVDLELTGLDPAADEIIAFATVTVAAGRVRLSDVRYRLVRPRHMPGPETIRIHGLREADLSRAPSLTDVVDEILEALTGRVLVAHVAAVEVGFLRAALGAHGLVLRNRVVDTAALAAELARRRRRSLPGDAGERSGFPNSSPGLSGLARSLGLPVHRPHHADGDALTTAQVFLALATHLDALEPQTVGSLERASRAVTVGPARRALRRLASVLRRSG